MEVLALDCEASYGKYGIIQPWDDGFYLSCVSLVTGHTQRIVWFDHNTEMPTPYGAKEIQEAIDKADIIVGHNLKFDMNVLKYHCGINFGDKELFCTMVGDYLITGQNTREFSFSLDEVCKRYGLEPKLDKVRTCWEAGIDTYDIEASILKEYVIDDSKKAFQLYLLEQKKIDTIGLNKVVELQNEFTHALSDMECSGFRWDAARAAKIITETKEEIKYLTNTLLDIIDIEHINLGSSSQLSAILYGGPLKTEHTEWTRKVFKNGKVKEWDKPIVEEFYIKGLGFTPLKGTETKKEGIYQTNKPTLKRLVCKTPKQRETKKLLFELSKQQKVLSTMQGKSGGLSAKVKADKNIHPSFNQAVTVTGRLSSSNPNGQNLPRGGTSPIKKCIIPMFDGILNFDLSQIEWRGAAELSGDVTMLHEINSGIDQHNAACTELMEVELNKDNRNHAKAFNFRMIYGGSAYGYYADSTMPNFSYKKWKKIVKGFYDKYDGLKLWQDKNIEFVYENGYIQILTGRLFHFNKDTLDQGVQTYSEKKIKNYPVQGLAGGDILPLLTILLRRGLKKNNLKSKMILTVHDSIVFDYKQEELERLKKLCEITMANLVDNIKVYFGIEWRARLDGEIEIGETYGNLVGI